MSSPRALKPVGAVPLARVLEIRRGEKRGDRIVVLDDGREITLTSAWVKRSGLMVGAAIQDSDLATLCTDAARDEAHEAALRFLSYRPRTGQEILLKLRQGGIDAEIAEREVRRLRMAGLINDEAFAEQWIEGRQRKAARSSRALAGELRAKGIDRPIAEAATQNVDDFEAALSVARAREAQLTRFDDATRERRLAGLLQRRGFSYGTIQSVMRQLAADADGTDIE